MGLHDLDLLLGERRQEPSPTEGDCQRVPPAWRGRQTVKRKMGIHWHLRALMATKGMYMTSDLVPKLTERGVELSREQVYRLVTHEPERLNVYVLAALCDILECTPNDLIEPVVEHGTVRKKTVAEGTTADVRTLRPTRARIKNKP